MKSFKFAFLMALVICATSSAFAQSAFDGTWTADVARPAPAPAQHLTITLATDKGKVSGTMTIDGGPKLPIEWGIVKGDLITFKVNLPLRDTSNAFVHLGRVDGDKLMLGRRPEDLTKGVLVEYTAQREK